MTDRWASIAFGGTPFLVRRVRSQFGVVGENVGAGLGFEESFVMGGTGGLFIVREVEGLVEGERMGAGEDCQGGDAVGIWSAICQARLAPQSWPARWKRRLA